MKNIFWTGGFDSTFRLLELVSDDKVSSINLYYIALNIDDVENSNVGRRSITNEIETMIRILNNIDTSKIKKFTIIGKSEDLLYYSFQFTFPFMNFISKDKIEYSDKNKSYFFDLLVEGLVLRPITQWGAITQLLDDLNIEAEICLEKEGGIWSRINRYVIDGQIQFSRMSALNAFKRYQIPLFNINRQQMIQISDEKNWKSILQMTWSCWYPKDGLQCGKCFTCVRRPKL